MLKNWSPTDTPTVFSNVHLHPPPLPPIASWSWAGKKVHFRHKFGTKTTNLSPIDTHNFQDSMYHPITRSVIGHFGHPHCLNPGYAPEYYWQSRAQGSTHRCNSRLYKQFAALYETGNYSILFSLRPLKNKRYR